MSKLLERVWEKGIDYPEWMTEPAIVTLKSDYIPEGYTPKTTMELVGRQVELELGITGIAEKVFNCLWKGYIGLSSPIWSNFGRKRGLPISCFNSHISDSILDFKKKDLEIAIMSKNGGGTSAYLGDVRGRGEKIANTVAKANGVMSPIKMIDNTIQEVSQGGVRRGMLAGYLDFSHPDIMEFLDIREVGHDIQTITTGVVIDKTDIDAIMTGDTKALDMMNGNTLMRLKLVLIF
jgi:ribonucleoside-diphosphate reductase alpha chain